MALSGAVTLITTTDDGGGYAFAALPAGQYRVTPTHSAARLP
jgi:hypothetical protein